MNKKHRFVPATLGPSDVWVDPKDLRIAKLEAFVAAYDEWLFLYQSGQALPEKLAEYADEMTVAREALEKDA